MSGELELMSLLRPVQGEVLLDDTVLNAYTAHITQNVWENVIEVNRAVLDQVREVASRQSWTDAAHFSNEVGVKLRDTHLQPSTESYGMAFMIEYTANPYSSSCPIYAGNFIHALHRAKEQTGTNPTEEDGQWLVSKSAVLARAISCVIHFKNLAYYQDGYARYLQEHDNKFVWLYAQNQEDAQENASKEEIGRALLAEIGALAQKRRVGGSV